MSPKIKILNNLYVVSPFLFSMVLTQAGCTDVNEVLPDGKTRLHQAIDPLLGGGIPEIKRLLRHGADINANDAWGRSPVFLAIEYGDLELVKFLVSRGAKTDVRGPNDETLLHVCVYPQMHLSDGIFYYLLSLGLDINAKDKYNRTPLHWAVLGKNDVKNLKTILESGADTGLQDSAGNTPADLANTEEKQLLLKKK